MSGKFYGEGNNPYVWDLHKLDPADNYEGKGPEPYSVRLELSKDKGPEVYPVREDVPAELWGKPIAKKQAVRELVRRETIEYYTEAASVYTDGDMLRRVPKTEQSFPDGEGDYTGPDNPLVSTYYEYIGGRK